MMINWLIKNIYASVEIKGGKITDCFHRIPQGFIIDLKDLLEDRNTVSGVIYVKMKQNVAHIAFNGNFDSGLKQRVRNCWGIHKAKYK